MPNSYAPPISLDEALQRISQLDAPIRCEQVDSCQALGRVLAEDLQLPGDLPPFDRTTMDGFAIIPHNSENESQNDDRSFIIKGRILAGEQWQDELTAGDAIRIMTGAPAPQGCIVVPIEFCDHDSDRVTIDESFGDLSTAAIGRNIAKRGEDGRQGDTFLTAGTRLRASTLAAAAMSGISSFSCYQLPRVLVMSTGAELTKQTSPDNAAAINDSNGPLLIALLHSLGIQADYSYCPDDIEQIKQLDTNYDLIISSGSVSKGDVDIIPKATQELGYETIFHGVAIQPGKPILLAQNNGSKACWLGLPGNPVSVLATAHIFFTAVLARWWPNGNIHNGNYRWQQTFSSRNHATASCLHGLPTKASKSFHGMDPVTYLPPLLLMAW